MSNTRILPLFGGSGLNPSNYYTKEEINQMLGDLESVSYEVVESLPETGESNVIYLLQTAGQGTDIYQQWIWTNNQWVCIGDTSVDLSNYATLQYVDESIANIPTVQGVRGFQGVMGETGLQGADGVQGYTGLQGSNGATGLQGAKGATGLQGADGIQGATGLQGSEGAQGATGETGLQGADGIQGYTGLQGSVGETGAQGTTGETGLQGADGRDGTDGLQGYIGLQGYTGVGLQGATGAQGTMGIQGPAGRDGSGGGADITYINNMTQEQLIDFYNNYMLGDIIDYLPLYVDTLPVVEHFTQPEEYNNEEVDVVWLGYEPYIEPSEDSANVGLLFYKVYPDGNVDDNAILEGVLVTVTGLQNALQDISGGIQGVQGAMGLQGETGAQGATGANGADGLQGYIGIQGAAGSNGIDGLQGYTGAQGADGKDGIDGLQGYIGIQGFEGIQGFTGETGEQGVQGIAGSNGADGLQGYTGFQGIQGADGGAGMERVDLLEMDTQELIDFHDDYIAEMATIDDIWYGQYKVVGAEAVEQQEGNRNTRSALPVWVYLYLSPWVSEVNNTDDLTQPYVILKPDGSLEETNFLVVLDSGGGSYSPTDVSAMTQQELADFYDAYVNDTISNYLPLYNENYPITDHWTNFEEYNNEEVDVVYLVYEVNTYEGDSEDTAYASQQYFKIYPDGTTDYGSFDAELVTVTGLQNALQDISGGQGIQGIQGTDGLQGYIGIQGLNGSNGTDGFQGIQGVAGIDGNVSSNTVELQFILEDNSMVNYEVYIRQ